MRILIIGGTRFYGRRLVGSAVLAGHDITVFHRGNHPIGSAGDVREILGDRNTDLDKLDGLQWDAVIDTCGYLPQSVAASVEALKGSVGLYVFVSSISAYGDFSKPFYDEKAGLARLSPEQESEVLAINPSDELSAPALGAAYGGAKVICEEIVQEGFPQNSLIVRPGLIVGKFDHTDRFTYWVMRIAAGGSVLAPGNPESFVQFIDAGDLADWTIKAIGACQSGVFNVTGEPGALTFGGMLNEIRSATKSNAAFTWVSEEFLRENEVAAWSDMPLFMFQSYETEGIELASIGRAKECGLVFSGLKQTVSDLLSWRDSVGRAMRAGISLSRESELLKLWSEQNTASAR
jgi:2'-hydroxyisoflavone reductase